MDSAALLDQLIAAAWPAAETELFAGWQYRWTSDVTRRANSALAIGGDEDLVKKIRHGELFYGRRGAQPTVLVSAASAPPTLTKLLIERGYTATSRTCVVRGTASRIIAAASGGSWLVTATGDVTDAWFDTYWSAEAAGRFGDDARPTVRDVLLAPDRPAVYAYASRDNRCAAVGQIVVDSGWAGLQCIATHPDYRRQGAASSVMRRLAEEVRKHGGDDVYLAVMADNHGARRLYERLGFVLSHEYCYFVPATSGRT